MRPLVSPAEMARADEDTIASGTPGYVLMERAGRAVARAAIDVAGGRYGKRAAVVCGKGNNGGDGFVAARALAAAGLRVRCFSLVPPDAFAGDPRAHLTAMRAAGIALEDLSKLSFDGCDVIVDAIFGTGFKGPAEGPAAAAIEAIAGARAPVVAVDIPSGVEGATGAVRGVAVRAAVTVALAAEKLGTALTPGSLRSGEVRVADIGIAVEGERAWVSAATDVARVLPRRDLAAHKRSGGSVVLLAGSEGMSGAALLGARAAGRTGAGYVTLVTTEYVDRAKASLLPEAVSFVAQGRGELGAEVLDDHAAAIGRADAAAVGPGLGTGERQSALVAAVLERVQVPIVIDADGLNAVARRPGDLEGRRGPAVITPHPGEMARLMNMEVGDVETDRLGAAREAARRFECVTLLKGPGTVVTAPDGRAVVNPSGGPELATAGTGDVLTGIVAALLAAGLDPFEAAWAAAFVHGRAGELAAGRMGGAGVLAWDVAEAVPTAIASVVGASADNLSR